MLVKLEIQDYNKAMQISNPAISSYLNNTINRSHQPDRFPVKAVTIEGELVDDKKQQTEANKTADFKLNEAQAKLLAPAPQVPDKLLTDTSNDLLFKQKQVNSFDNKQSPAEQNFPFAHRRSFEGLTGGSLVIQKYLNNESSALGQSDNLHRNIDIFI